MSTSIVLDAGDNAHIAYQRRSYDISDLTSGIYFCTLEAGDFIASEQFVVIE